MWTFFKCRRGAETVVKLTGYGNNRQPPKQNDLNIKINNFESINNNEDSFGMQVVSFHSDAALFLKLIFSHQVLTTLERMFPMDDLSKLIKQLGSVSMRY